MPTPLLTEPPAEAMTASAPTKRAALYLRVSSPGQVNTDYDREGLSLPAQRDSGTGKATSKDASVVREYVEAGVSGGSLVKRKAFRQMLKDIEELQDIDYVIVWSVSRWARNQEDYWAARGLINRAGAKLISVKEPIGEDTSYGVTIEGVMAAVAAGRRLEIAEEVMQGINRKLQVGGLPGRAPLGYLNIREPLPQGGEVRTVAIDETRADLIRWAFETYATGLYSLNDIETLLAARGLRSRGDRRNASKPLNHSSVHKLLSNPFYAGIITYRGKTYTGRHEPLISEDLFDQAQAVLKAHYLSGERDRKHSHYLKGSVFCNGCNCRLTYSRNTGNGGTYEYFVCPNRQRRQCSQAAQRVESVEAAIEQHYRTVQFSPADRDRVRAAVEQHLAQLATISQQEIDHCQQLLTTLKVQERKLLDKHYQDAISDELFQDEAKRIKRERKDAEAITARLSLRHDELATGLTLALKLASADLHDLYAKASPTIRRLMNQAIFTAIWVWDEDKTSSKLASPFNELAAFEQTSKGAKPDTTTANLSAWTLSPARGINGEVSDAMTASETSDVGLISANMVELVGIEPTTFWLPASQRNTAFLRRGRATDRDFALVLVVQSIDAVGPGGHVCIASPPGKCGGGSPAGRAARDPRAARLSTGGALIAALPDRGTSGVRR
jgi:site-specific DNA recombinase